MADTKLRLPLGVSGLTVYTRLKNESGQIWQTTTSTFVSYVVADVANYALATPETPASSGDYEATMPAGAAAGNYTWAHYSRAGGSAAISDSLLGSGGAAWDGTSFGGVGDAVELPDPAPDGYGPIGTGSVNVDHDYPTADALTFQLTGGQGIGQARVYAFLASEYTSSPATATIRGQTLTLSDGTWANAIMLDPGSYKIVFKHPSFQDYVASVTVS